MVRMPAEPSCVICRAQLPDHVIAAGDLTWVTAGPAAPLPGYVCLVSRVHVAEPFELPTAAQAVFWQEVCAVARAIRDATDARKINYEIHGNTIEHLHLHVFPRYPGDPFQGRPIDGASHAFHRSPESLARLAAVAASALEPGADPSG